MCHSIKAAVDNDKLIELFENSLKGKPVIIFRMNSIIGLCDHVFDQILHVELTNCHRQFTRTFYSNTYILVNCLVNYELFT